MLGVRIVIDLHSNKGAAALPKSDADICRSKNGFGANP
jgi:hypothetical protein